MGKKVMLCMGTRPEIIKMAPVHRALRAIGMEAVVFHTGQHRELAMSLYRLFDITPAVQVDALERKGGSLAELGAHAKAKPDAVNYGSVGTGSSNHLNMLAFEARTGTKMVHVPYKGGAPMMQDLVAGQIDTMFVSARRRSRKSRQDASGRSRQAA